MGTQASEMDLDDEEEDEVVVKDGKASGGRKQTPSLPPKLSRKWHTLGLLQR